MDSWTHRPIDLLTHRGGTLVHTRIFSRWNRSRAMWIVCFSIILASFLSTADLAAQEAAEGTEPLEAPSEVPATIVKVECNNGQQALVELIAFLNERDLRLVSVETLEPNLESVFLHLTGKKLRE